MNRAEFTYIIIHTRKLRKDENLMQNIILALGIILFLIGFGIIVGSCIQDNLKAGLLGIIMIFIGLMIITLTPIHITKWQETNELCEIVNGEYLIETTDGYVFKKVIFSELGERNEEYVQIRKEKETSVDIVSIERDETPIYKVVYNEEKALFGNVLKRQTNYIFYITK